VYEKIVFSSGLRGSTLCRLGLGHISGTNFVILVYGNI